MAIGRGRVGIFAIVLLTLMIFLISLASAQQEDECGILCSIGHFFEKVFSVFTGKTVLDLEEAEPINYSDSIDISAGFVGKSS